MLDLKQVLAASPIDLAVGDFNNLGAYVLVEATALLRRAAENVLRPWPVSTRVNTLENDTVDLLDPIEAGAA